MFRGARGILSSNRLYAIPFILVLIICSQFLGCPRGRLTEPEPVTEEPTPLRPVRVLLGSALATLRFSADRRVTITDGDAGRVAVSDGEDWHLVEAVEGGGVRVDGNDYLSDVIELTSGLSGSIRVSLRGADGWDEPRTYPGRLRLTPGDDGTLRLLNLVDVDRYVASVVAHEVWPSFATEAYRAQAIVARSFVVYQMRRRAKSSYDVSATQASQVYRGIREDKVGRRAAKATKYTRGIVCTWRNGGEDKLFSTYYSAACGGVSQSASIFGKADDVPPLRGGVRCDYCKIAPGETYRWGPVRISTDEVFSRLTDRYPEMASLGGISSIAIIKRTAAGRPVDVRIDGLSGESRELMAERFRLALGSMRVRSTDFKVRATTSEVVFTNGKGFGHGLGLCQWGMEGQAVLGKKAGAILRHYFPGCRLTRIY